MHSAALAAAEGKKNPANAAVQGAMGAMGGMGAAGGMAGMNMPKAPVQPCNWTEYFTTDGRSVSLSIAESRPSNLQSVDC